MKRLDPDQARLEAAKAAVSSDLEMKVLTVKNWLEPDYVPQIFARLDVQAGTIRPIAGEEYLEDVLAPKLDPAVPREIRRLSEIGRGIMAYGYFFYPLYAVSVDELYRVAEAAARLRVSQEGGPSGRKFEVLIDWLSSKSVLTPDETTRWHALRSLRNRGTHRNRPTMFPATMAVSLAQTVAEDINALFGVPRPRRRRAPPVR